MACCFLIVRKIACEFYLIPSFFYLAVFTVFLSIIAFTRSPASDTCSFKAIEQIEPIEPILLDAYTAIIQYKLLAFYQGIIIF